MAVALAQPSAAGADSFVSVVVCTAGRRRAALRACLDSLRALDDPAFEIVVVDNGREATVAADEVLTAGCRVVREPRRGLDRARNAGVAAASGDVIAFVDDDCEVDRGWLASVRAAFADPAVGAVTGRVRPASLAQPSERWFEAWFSFDRGGHPRRFAPPPPDVAAFPGALGTGCNMAFRRAALDAAGPFDEAIEVGTLVGGGGDLDMFARVLDAGEQVAYVPEALVVHHHRVRLGDLRWQFWGYGVSFGALCWKFFLRRPAVRRRIVVLVWRRLRYQHARQLRARARGRASLPASLVLLDACGIVVGPFAYGLAVAVARLTGARR